VCVCVSRRTEFGRRCWRMLPHVLKAEEAMHHAGKSMHEQTSFAVMMKCFECDHALLLK
jgi:hypothetical protein